MLFVITCWYIPHVDLSLTFHIDNFLSYLFHLRSSHYPYQIKCSKRSSISAFCCVYNLCLLHTRSLVFSLSVCLPSLQFPKLSWYSVVITYNISFQFILFSGFLHMNPQKLYLSVISIKRFVNPMHILNAYDNSEDNLSQFSITMRINQCAVCMSAACINTSALRQTHALRAVYCNCVSVQHTIIDFTETDYFKTI